MSTTIPFTLIEGAMALPSLRPLGHISRSFGREWSLLPPNVSFRVELKALYAAMLRTFCLSSDAIRSMCKWEPRGAQPQAAATQATGAPLPDAIARGVVISTDAPNRPHGKSNLLAGSACAISGAAILAWLVLDHLPQNGAAIHAPDTTPPALSQAQHVESPQPNSSASGATAVAVQSDVAATAAASATAHNATASTTARPLDERVRTQDSRHPDFSSSAGTNAARVVSPTVTTPPRASAPHAIARDGAYRSGNATRAGREAASQRQSGANRAASLASQHPLMPTPATHHAQARPSAAGDYSPFAPAQLASDEYASVTLSAATHIGTPGNTQVNDLPSAQRSPLNVDTNSTSWMDHMSQRRVTEVPERFSR
ncbi:MAG TPA: hypothetical protein VGL08_15300 [Paraburkholderia sp.]|jgi:hypothetical protein